MKLDAQMAGGGRITALDAVTQRLSLPPGDGRTYRLAQLDDYTRLPRKAFRWQAPARLELRARVSAPDLPGTWGFGWWNDPFSAGLGLGGGQRRMPTLPNTAWFFYASPPNHLAFRDDHPADGLLAAVFSAPRALGLMLAAGLPALPLLAWRVTARAMRRTASRFIKEDAVRVDRDVTASHTYTIDWQPTGVHFSVDGQPCFETPIAPEGPLGLVIWIDNQYAAFPPDGRVRMGALPCATASALELTDLTIESTRSVVK